MKHHISRLVILFTVMLASAGASAQNVDKLHAEDGLFNHLSIGLSNGLTGAGLDVAMPVHKLVTVRAGFSGWNIGKAKFKAINTATEITQLQLVEEDAVKRAQMVDKVELAVKPNFWNFYALGEVHPFNDLPFYFSAGLFVGSKNFIQFENTQDGTLGFLCDANNKVQDYNRVYRTNYPPIGLKFGDYVFTADENGNIDVRMKTNVVKPYIGVGFGRQIARARRVSLAVDAGLLFWGTPRFLLNDGTEIKSNGSNSGITSVLSWLKAWPNIELRLAYKVF